MIDVHVAAKDDCRFEIAFFVSDGVGKCKDFSFLL